MFITSSLSPNQCLSIPYMRPTTNWHCFVPWKHQAAGTDEISSLFFSSGRSFFSVLSKGSLYHPGFLAVLFLTPEHTSRLCWGVGGFPTSRNSSHHPSPHSSRPGGGAAGRQDGVPVERITLPLLHPLFSCHPFLTGCRSYQGSIKPGGLWPRRGG